MHSMSSFSLNLPKRKVREQRLKQVLSQKAVESIVLSSQGLNIVNLHGAICDLKRERSKGPPSVVWAGYVSSGCSVIPFGTRHGRKP
ncbi:Uncharacterized protein HZ326_17401 [Fusarium oxysporum f. sp. albedinis]|nr:Uncharacterized protein HZ326_17401 [Fusarium oxysporum f. sp. albedinis]